ncbi:MAG: hypothetical protein M3388_00905 [Acidobacteriota bacterium]|nr:hypothetical protein [Acidobacteriota bacterium]
MKAAAHKARLFRLSLSRINVIEKREIITKFFSFADVLNFLRTNFCCWVNFAWFEFIGQMLHAFGSGGGVPACSRL